MSLYIFGPKQAKIQVFGFESKRKSSTIKKLYIKLGYRCTVCQASFISRALLLVHKADHGTLRSDGKLKIKPGKKPKMIYKQETHNENVKIEEEDVDLDIVPLPLSKNLQSYNVP